MKRLCVFAHWDKDNIIDDYILYYLQALRDVCYKIIFVSDCDLSNEETQKLAGIVDVTVARKHGEYDFGSYKKGFFYAKENNIEFDELLFVNDSCYGPFYPLKHVFDKMSKKKCDFWGLTKNSYGIKKENGLDIAEWNPHIQSYFILFRKSVFTSNVFLQFIQNIKQEQSKSDVIINYEIGLTKTLTHAGFKPDVYINRYSHTENCLSSKWKRLIKWYKFPFIKTSLIKNGIFVLGEIKDWEQTVESVSSYPVNIIKKNANRYKNPEPNLYKTFNLYRKIRFIVLQNCPMEMRKIVIKLEKSGYKILNTLFFHKLKKF